MRGKKLINTRRADGKRQKKRISKVLVRRFAFRFNRYCVPNLLKIIVSYMVKWMKIWEKTYG